MPVSLLFIVLLFLQPSDTFLTPDAEEMYQKAGFAETNFTTNFLTEQSNKSFAEEFTTKFGDFYSKTIQYEKIKKAGVDNWEMELFDRRNDQMAFLQSRKSELSDAFFEHVSEEIKYNYWHLLLAYAINRSNENTDLKQVTSLPRIMTMNFDHASMANEKLLHIKSFRALLPYYITYFNSEERNFQKYSNGNQSLADKAEFAAKRFKGKVLDLALAEIISLSAGVANENSFSFWTSQLSDHSLKEYLSATFKELVAQNEAKKSNAPEVTFENLAGEKISLSSFKGKVIYVDFWASWCGPCRQEFPFSKQLQNDLKNKDEVVFLYISIDENKEAWKKAVSSLGLDKGGVNVYAPELAAAYGVSAIPRYMLFNKEGQLVDPNAPRPSDPETLSRISELL